MFNTNQKLLRDIIIKNYKADILRAQNTRSGVYSGIENPPYHLPLPHSLYFILMFPSPLNDHVNDLEHPAAGQHGLGGNKYPSGGGKTFTMVGTQDCPGIMVRALNHLFNQMDQDTDSVYKVRKAIH